VILVYTAFYLFIFSQKGTTGSPKGALLSNHSLVNNAMQVGRLLALDVQVCLHNALCYYWN